MENCIDKIKKFETLFSDNQYNGSGKTAFVIEEGNIPIMISAPHAVNQFREGQVKWADMYTGGIARYLHEITGCHLIYSCMFTKSDPNYDEPGINKYQDTLQKFVNEHKVVFLIDLHGASKKREYALELGTVPKQSIIQGKEYEQDSSLHEYKIVSNLIKNIFEKNFQSLSLETKDIWKNKIFNAGDQNTVTKYISENTSTACVQLEINRLYRDPENKEAFNALITGLYELINELNSKIGHLS